MSKIGSTPGHDPLGEGGRCANQRTRGQTGASLAFALGVLVFCGIVMAAVVSFASTNQRTIRAYDGVREARYQGDGAVKAAINWAKDNPGVAVDPEYYGEDANGLDSNERCVLPVEIAGEPVTASCFVEPGSGSGLPSELGLVPDAALQLMGARHNEPGPYSTTGCESTIWTDISDFFTRFVGSQPQWRGRSESSLLGQRIFRATNIGNVTVDCVERVRDMETMKISGPVVAAGKVDVPQGTLTVHGTNAGDTPLVAARYGCSGNVQRMLPDNSVVNGCNTWAEANTAGLSDADPGLVDQNGRSSINNTVTAYQPIGFEVDGDGDLTGAVASGSVLNHERTTAYVYDPTFVSTDTSVPRHLKPAAGCVGLPAASAIIFIPGWYRNVDVLNRYTAHPDCADRTIWFAPDAGPDRDLLSGDDQTGPFYFDLTAAHYSGPSAYNQAATNQADRRGCGGFTNLIPSRWCVGGSSTAEPRIVVGTPAGWSPLVTAASGSGPGDDIPYGGSRVRVDLTRAESVDDVDESNWLRFLEFRPWSNLQPGVSTLGDTAFATYRPCRVEFLGYTLYRCPSLGSRQVRVADFTPKATSGPVQDADAVAGRISVTVEYAMNASAASTLNRPTLEIEATDDYGRTKFCGSYELAQNASHVWSPPIEVANPMPKYTFTDAQQVELAATCGAREEINSYRMFLKVGGNRNNSGDPRVYFGGIAMHFDTYIGASFPYAEPDSASPAAKSDCDPKAPGGQLIFGGASHVYVADGSLEVCAGVHPGGNTAAATHQVIGVYGVPQVKPLRVNPAVDPTPGGDLDPCWPCDPVGPSGSWAGASSKLVIGEPAGVQSIGLGFGKNCSGCGSDPYGKGRFSVKMEGYSPPAGYKVTKVTARAAWKDDSNRFCLGPLLGVFKGACNGWSGKLLAPADLVNYASTKADNQVGFFAGRNWGGSADSSAMVLYAEGSVDRITTAGSNNDWSSRLAGGLDLTWEGRIPCQEVFWVMTCVGRSMDHLDGIEVDVTLAPADDGVPMLVPQSGCVTAHPNYSAGNGLPDCALVRADAWDQTTSGTSSPICWGDSCVDPQRGKWNGRLSVKGTIYAPSSAFEIDDADIAYPLATRGAIMRHLRVSGWGLRDGYTGSAISNDIDDTPTPRSAVFTACKQSAARRAQRVPCDPDEGDTTLTRAGVSFVVPTVDGVPGPSANVPIVNWWADDRMTA